MQAHKLVQFVPDISTDLIKKRAKELSTPEARITFNDVLMTALSKALRDYLRDVKNDKETKQIMMTCPFSLRRTPAELNDFEFNNDFAIVPLNLRLVDDISTGVKQISRDMNKLKQSMEPIILYYLIKITMQLPHFLREFIFEDFCTKFSVGFSNVPGSRRQ